MCMLRPLFVVVVSTLAVLALVQWCAPTLGATRNLADLSGPDGFQAGSPDWPRTVTDFDGARVTIPGPVNRVVSQYWSIDEFVYTVLPETEVVGVSESAYLERVSNVYPQVQRHKPVVGSDPERVVRANPELVMVSSGARADFTTLIRSTEIPVYRLATMFTNLGQVAETIRLTGYLTGHDEAAESEYQRFQSVIARAREAKPAGAPSPRVLGFGGRYGYGGKTLFHDVVTTLGCVNVAAEGGLHGYGSVNSEQILRWNPEWIIAGAEAGKEQEMLRHLLEDAVIRQTDAARDGKILVYDQRVFLPMSPFTSRILELLSKDLYGS
jgi:iron complex transport system substrate-binding protein